MIRFVHQSSTFESLSRLAADEWRRAEKEGFDVSDVGREIGQLLEFGLCGAFTDSDAFRGYWCDGFVFSCASRDVSGRLVLDGYIWCADHKEQWVVPGQACFEFDRDPAPKLERVSVLLGDGAVC